MKKTVTPPRDLKSPTPSSTRWSEDDLRLIEALKKKTGISSAAGVQKHCLRIAAEKYGVKL